MDAFIDIINVFELRDNRSTCNKITMYHLYFAGCVKIFFYKLLGNVENGWTRVKG